MSLPHYSDFTEIPSHCPDVLLFQSLIYVTTRRPSITEVADNVERPGIIVTGIEMSRRAIMDESLHKIGTFSISLWFYDIICSAAYLHYDRIIVWDVVIPQWPPDMVLGAFSIRLYPYKRFTFSRTVHYNKTPSFVLLPFNTENIYHKIYLPPNTLNIEIAQPHITHHTTLCRT